jgi:hypothetical protein
VVTSSAHPDLEQRDRHRVQPEHDRDHRRRRGRVRADPQRDPDLEDHEVHEQDRGEQRGHHERQVVDDSEPRLAVRMGGGREVRETGEQHAGHDRGSGVEGEDAEVGPRLVDPQREPTQQSAHGHRDVRDRP